MIYLKLFEVPKGKKPYRGLYRADGICDYMKSGDELDELIDCFFRETNETVLRYTAENRKKALELQKSLELHGWAGELIAFTDDVKVLSENGMTFLGYDICADSMHYSPIGGGIMDAYSDDVFFSEMSEDKYEHFKNGINEFVLFESIDVAREFADYCNFVNEKHRNCVESENNWRAFAVYKVESD